MRVLSLGAGVQSSTVALMIAKGELPPIDAAVFADTGAEPSAVYEWFSYLERQLPFPIYKVEKGNLELDVLSDRTKEARWMLPSFTEGGGMGKRQCTKNYKIAVIRRKVRQLNGGHYKPVEQLIGISTDEVMRCKPSGVKYITHTFPLIDLGMSRQDCVTWLEKHGYAIPPKSSCIFCPYRGLKSFAALDTDELDRVIEMDEFIRDRGAMPGVKQYLIPQRIPLRQALLERIEEKQVDLFNNECEGMCGV